MTAKRGIRQLLPALTALVCSAANLPTAAHAEAQPLLVVFTGAEAVDAREAVELQQAGLVWRVRLEAPDSAAGEWTVVVYLVTGGRRTAVIWLGNGQLSTELPRPLGIPFEAGDSLHVHLAVLHEGGLPGGVRVSIDYEQRAEQTSRMPVLPLRPAPGSTAATAHAWDWTMAGDGRLMAVAGLRAEVIGEVLLQDAETGEVLWRETLQPDNAQAFGVTSDVVRSGVLLRAGRSYRLTIIGATVTAPVALITPLRTRSEEG
jgi:hypothetical protein